MDHKCKIFQTLNGAVGMLPKQWIARGYKWTSVCSTAAVWYIHFGAMTKVYCVDIATIKIYWTWAYWCSLNTFSSNHCLRVMQKKDKLFALGNIEFSISPSGTIDVVLK